MCYCVLRIPICIQVKVWQDKNCLLIRSNPKKNMLITSLEHRVRRQAVTSYWQDIFCVETTAERVVARPGIWRDGLFHVTSLSATDIYTVVTVAASRRSTCLLYTSHSCLSHSFDETKILYYEQNV